jgi:hypothetical protein
MAGEVRDIARIIAREHELEIPERALLDALVRSAFDNHLGDDHEDVDDA